MPVTGAGIVPPTTPVTNGSILFAMAGTTTSTFRVTGSKTVRVMTIAMMDGAMIIAATTGMTTNGVVMAVVSTGEASHD